MISTGAARTLIAASMTLMGLGGWAAHAQTPAAEPPLDQALIDDLVAANHILAMERVLDGFGHISVRDPRNPNRYVMSRSVAPESVTAADILVFDLDSNPVDPKDQGKGFYKERFIHGEIYKVRPDVKAIVHSHSPTVVPFSVTNRPLRPILHNAAFLGLGAPVFEIRKYGGDGTDMLVEKPALGKGLAQTLGKKAAVVLMRGHGDAVVAPTLRDAVFRAYYTEVNARLQMQAISIGGPITYLSKAEAETTDEDMLGASARPWAMWKRKVQTQSPGG
jgi:ribulose-5-phosphate 4-epimerase/fuculose-1-phosphate aldolase